MRTKNKRKRFCNPGLLLCLGLVLLGAQPIRADERILNYHIPPQSLTGALNDYADAANVQLSYPAEITTGMKCSGLEGKYTSPQALRKLLAGTGLSVKPTASGAITLVRQEGLMPVADTAPAPVAGSEQTMPKVMVEADAEVDAYDPMDTTHPYNKSYAVSNVTTATKTDKPIFDTPVSVQTIPKSVIRDQQAIRVGDALRNVSGYFDTRGEEFFYDTAFLRGFDTGSSQYIDGLRDVSMSHSLAMSERIDVLKGPAGALYGRLEPGGLINYVTKRPLDMPFYSLQQQFGSFNKYRTLVDLTGPITQDKSLLYRINMEYHNSDSFMDVVHQERSFLAPSLTWRISPQTKVDLDFRYHNVNGPSTFGHPAVGARPANIPEGRYFGEPSLDTGDWNLLYGGLSLSHAFNDNWKLDAKVGYNHNRQFSQGIGIDALDEQTGNASRWLSNYDYQMDSIQGLINVTGKFDTWGAKHTLAFGGDIYKTEMKTYWYQYLCESCGGGFPSRINSIFEPMVYQQQNFDLKNEFKGSTSSGHDSWWGLYIQDQVSLFDNWELMFGTRYDQARTSWDESPTTDDGEFSPRVGLLYHPLPWLAVYGNYSKALNAANSVNVRPGTQRKPQMSEGFEAGLKGNWFDGKLSANLTFYELTKKNISQPDPNANGRDYSIFIGKGRSRGIEFDITGQITDYLSIIGTYSYTDTKVIQDAYFQGNAFYNVPKHAGSLWAKCDFDSFGVPGFWTGAGVYLVGQRQGDGGNTFQMPGYTRVDAGLGYTFKTGPSKISLQFNVDNLLDNRYYVNSTWASRTGGIQPGAPRTFIGSVRVDF
jgi:iron complex outermembrane recepter protein